MTASAAVLLSGSLMTASAAEADAVPMSITYAYVGGGHAGYNTANHHAWVCDDASDGHSVYGVYHFADGNTEYQFGDTDGNNGNCADRYFDKSASWYKVCLSKAGFDPCSNEVYP
ncbi:hypothetical protein RKE30_20395 [Streptomyces sp. Li-HN-5-11]|uniref:hypothetical protein n=1 Tax=Streptomyces sp. Li-HN-5-11 TaxID=3075432 RepID=UPI0028AF08B9|nr:hypothetical protein [Streptomyces sp. Li-HN-5-11]WNM32606.1 hypothetical protein RKE30_20395 [Streptomyces sp. Li-HN-5-11]